MQKIKVGKVLRKQSQKVTLDDQIIPKGLNKAKIKTSPKFLSKDNLKHGKKSLT